MQKNFYWKMISVFCMTFTAGFLSFSLLNTWFAKPEIKKSNHSKFVNRQKINDALQKIERSNTQCVPIDKNLSYRYVKNLNASDQTLIDLDSIDDISKVNEEIIELERSLEDKSDLESEQREEFEEDLKKRKGELNKLLEELFEFDESKNLLYREECRKIK